MWPAAQAHMEKKPEPATSRQAHARGSGPEHYPSSRPAGQSMPTQGRHAVRARCVSMHSITTTAAFTLLSSHSRSSRMCVAAGRRSGTCWAAQ